MIKTIAALSTATALLGVAVASPAQADIVEGTLNGYQAQINDSGSYASPDFISVYGPAGLERVTVTCAPFDWQSYGSNTVEFVDSIARAWCF